MFRAALVAACCLPAGADPAVAQPARPGDRATLESLSGVFASAAPEPWYGGCGTRRFGFENGRWSLVFTHALDAGMQRPTFVFRTQGAFRVGAPSTTVPGAFEAVFFEDAKLVTLLTTDAAVIRAFGFAGCGLVARMEVDISARGCAGWKPVAICREDHDLLALSAEGLHFGVRPRDNDMCTPDRRPTALLPAVVAQ
ncbi:MAG TPA: hypothetical protein VGN83_07840 [Falsiroseomonas sp.]|jgi:hypothetical protein|nr:hypothetical protein [Falsiroseomonas sp.]